MIRIRKMVSLECAWCSHEVDRRRDVVRQREQRVCSMKCSRALRGARVYWLRFCEKCLIRHIRPQRHASNSTRSLSKRFCSNRCAAEARTITSKCERCGSAFHAEAASLRKGKGRFCSAKCYHDYRKYEPTKYAIGRAVAMSRAANLIMGTGE